MTASIALTEEERVLLVDLLENESRSLPSEIRRADAFVAREVLQDRLKRVDQLLGKIQEAAVAK